MKLPLRLIASLSLAASPIAFANTELETLRARCLEQERQIRHLEDENSKLRSLTGEKTTKPAAPAAPVGDSPATGSTYVVKSGDNLEKIARQVGVSTDRLAKANSLRQGAIIQPGQKLKIPGAVATTANTPTASAPPSAPSAPPKPIPARTHTVKANETYSSISRKYKISTATLIAANPKIKPTALRQGQVINLGRPTTTPSQATTAQAQVSPPAPVPSAAKIPSAPAQAAAQPTPAPSTPATPAPTPPPAAPTAAQTTPPPVAPAVPPSSPEKKVRPIIIEQEITYGDFASKYGTDTDRLNALNGLDLTAATVLAKGSELYIPGQ